ncbi:MAG: hypothetical protein HS105_00140 [Chloracidobacterium sp.]|nr:hypothetical protein [Chloracidobacterium sp.]MCO5332419.1 protein-disulfide reductase DsbD N-terminal domain-containing protein [Pyrinomonadaceae bacterium]
MRVMFNKLMIAASLAFCFSIGVAAQSVSGSLPAATRGKAVRAAVVLNIPSGLHVNSSRPGSEYAIATSIRPSASRLKIGAVSYPRGRNRRFPFADAPVNVYQGRVVFPFTVTVPANYRGRSISVNVAVRYQACTDEVCYAPKTQNITLTARVK